MSRDLHRPSDPALAVRLRVAPETGPRAQQAGALAGAFLAAVILLGLVRGHRREGAAFALLGALVTLGVALAPTGEPARAAQAAAAIGAFDGWLYSALLRLAAGLLDQAAPGTAPGP